MRGKRCTGEEEEEEEEVATTTSIERNTTPDHNSDVEPTWE
jgi:hypothetical protein